LSNRCLDAQSSQDPAKVSYFGTDLYPEQRQWCKLKTKFKLLNVSTWRFSLLLSCFPSALQLTETAQPACAFLRVVTRHV